MNQAHVCGYCLAPSAQLTYAGHPERLRAPLTIHHVHCSCRGDTHRPCLSQRVFFCGCAYCWMLCRLLSTLTCVKPSGGVCSPNVRHGRVDSEIFCDIPGSRMCRCFRRSPDDSMLVSGSIDNTVIVWHMPTAEGQARPFGNTSAILTPFKTLRRHTSFVKVFFACVHPPSC